MNWVLIVGIVVAAIGLLLAWRGLDHLTDQRAWRALQQQAVVSGQTFDPSALAGLPPAARRYFEYTILPGARLCHAMELDMVGELGLGTKDAPGYRPIEARQILAPPHGLVWKVRAGAISGSDGVTPTTSWTRFWLAGLAPVVRAGGDADHHRSAIGRVIAEAAFWAPTALLPSDVVRWEHLDQDRARAIVTIGAIEQAVDITVDAIGQPTEVLIQRWSNENAENTYRLQPFGGVLSEFRAFDGYRLPTHVEGGNHFGTDAYFPFYKVTITDARCADPGRR